MWRLMVFFQGVLGLGVVVMSLVSGLMVLRHDGPSTELAQSVGLLVLLLGLLLVTGRRMTGRWFIWSRR
ncbi:hypothetical protein K388_05997 [Streptomyces sp. KhCrAH-43]|uniref:hypothetical protein n=1 Tax=unclassified Streptomyces TaxID=2593676 RepID=UPI00037EF53F|nr:MULTISPECIES: hypothetical protein [unclassified Streptomyces]MYS33655.1 hypothetical protein [Streptomyces sp. SID4920]MYX63752.1 hypothetical protein [Streptomyces sp. SID8373]RAJ52897.1 hypothetical protein K388_05997 [Streptomyces sp. KhCrAH-43]